MTNKEAGKIIEENKDNTAFYGKNNIDIFGKKINTFDNFYKMFRYRFEMGEAETLCIIAALKLSGAEID